MYNLQLGTDTTSIFIFITVMLLYIMCLVLILFKSILNDMVWLKRYNSYAIYKNNTNKNGGVKGD